jgi:flagellar biosynthesis chaperone FliJ
MPDNKTRREAAVLVIVVFLLGALLGGVGNHLWNQRVRGEQQQPGQKSRDQVIAEFTDQLGLTPDQQKQLGTIVDDTRAKWRELYAPLEPQHEAIRQQARDRIRSILSPEQLPKFETFVRKLDEQRKKEQTAR